MNVRTFAGFVIFVGIIFQLWGIAGCMNYGALMTTYDRRNANEDSGNRNFLIGSGLVFLGIALKCSSKKKRPESSKAVEIEQTHKDSVWGCECGQANSLSDEFCPNCGKPKTDFVWTCECGHTSTEAVKYCCKCGRERDN